MRRAVGAVADRIIVDYHMACACRRDMIPSYSERVEHHCVSPKSAHPNLRRKASIVEDLALKLFWSIFSSHSRCCPALSPTDPSVGAIAQAVQAAQAAFPAWSAAGLATRKERRRRREGGLLEYEPPSCVSLGRFVTSTH